MKCCLMADGLAACMEVNKDAVTMVTNTMLMYLDSFNEMREER